jgi:hypothetical protein
MAKDTNQNEKDVEEIAATHTDAWKNRRIMAYFALFSLIIFNVWVFFFIPESRLKLLEEAITWLDFTLASIVGAYMGFSVLDKKYSSKK